MYGNKLKKISLSDSKQAWPAQLGADDGDYGTLKSLQTLPNMIIDPQVALRRKVGSKRGSLAISSNFNSLSFN